jgi:hypothetical protein
MSKREVENKSVEESKTQRERESWRDWEGTNE